MGLDENNEFTELFIDVCKFCLNDDEFVNEFCRLKRIKRPDKLSPIEKIIDKSCGYNAEYDFIKQFTDFVMEYVFIPYMLKEE